MKHVLLFFLSTPLFVSAQLLPHIGLDAEPSPDDAICEIGDYNVDYEAVGFFEDEFVNDFTVYSPDGEEFTLSEELSSDKPVLLISGSYTCPVFRNKTSLINLVEATYGDQITIAVIYTVEAHPTDISPYFGYPNPGSANTNQGILYPQPTTYGERLDIIDDMYDNLTLNFPLYIDGPCNLWLETYGPAPNTSYLINPDGSVYSRHPWLDAYPDDIICDIEDLLGNDYDCPEDLSGNFQFAYDVDTIAYGSAGETIYVTATLSNNSSAPVLIECERLVLDMPDEWTSSMCLDICLQPEEIYREVHLEPGESQLYTNYFYTVEGYPGLGKAGIRFRNSTNPNNKFNRTFWAEATGPVGLDEVEANDIRLWPNPATDLVNITAARGSAMRVRSLSGEVVYETTLTDETSTLDLRLIRAGIYLVEFWDGKNMEVLRLVMI